MSEPIVLYEERDSVAVVTLNRHDKLNTLTEGMVQGVADAIDRATASREVRAIVLRGAGRALTGRYDLSPGDGASSAHALRDRQQRALVHPVRDEMLRRTLGRSQRYPGRRDRRDHLQTRIRLRP